MEQQQKCRSFFLCNNAFSIRADKRGKEGPFTLSLCVGKG